MRYFPIFIDLDPGNTVLVYGGSEDAARKVRLLLKTGAAISIVATSLNDELSKLVRDARLTWIAAGFRPEQLSGRPRAVFAACGDDTNALVSRAAQNHNIPVNVVDRADLSTFIIPAIVDRDPLVVAIGTEGAGPVLAQGVRSRIEAMLPAAVGGLLARAAVLRQTVANIIPAGPARRAFWDRYFFGAPRDAFLAGDEPGFADAVERQLASPDETTAAGRISLLDVCEDPELLTLKAHRLLLEADIIVHDRSVAPGVLEFARRDARRQSVDTSIWVRTPDHHLRTAEQLLKQAGAGRRIVRLYDANASALDAELTVLGAHNTTNIAIDHIRAAPDEHTWAPLIDGRTVDGITPWRLAS
ncbi:MAG: hypothetical protein HKN11_19395 [Rhizobiales bacterium]|nr:hypothetical protein [Hyphomicrobiales bacterium]